MRRRIDLAEIYDQAKRQIGLTRYGGKAALTPPAICPVTLDEWLATPVEALEAAFSATSAG
jgi:hypothetical protein